MNKSLAALCEFSRQIDLAEVYSITLWPNKVHLQCDFSSDRLKRLINIGFRFDVTDASGYVEGVLQDSPEFNWGILIYVTLT